MEPVKQKLEQMVADGVAVKEDGPTDWVNSMLVVDKKKKSRKKKKGKVSEKEPQSADDIRIYALIQKTLTEHWKDITTQHKPSRK